MSKHVGTTATARIKTASEIQPKSEGRPSCSEPPASYSGVR